MPCLGMLMVGWYATSRVQLLHRITSSSYSKTTDPATVQSALKPIILISCAKHHARKNWKATLLQVTSRKHGCTRSKHPHSTHFQQPPNHLTTLAVRAEQLYYRRKGTCVYLRAQWSEACKTITRLLHVILNRVVLSRVSGLPLLIVSNKRSTNLCANQQNSGGSSSRTLEPRSSHVRAHLANPGSTFSAPHASRSLEHSRDGNNRPRLRNVSTITFQFPVAQLTVYSFWRHLYSRSSLLMISTLQQVHRM